MNGASVLWIVEALGADEDALLAPMEELKQESDYRRCPAIVRRHVPWDVVAELAEQHLPKCKIRNRIRIPVW